MKGDLAEIFGAAAVGLEGDPPANAPAGDPVVRAGADGSGSEVASGLAPGEAVAGAERPVLLLTAICRRTDLNHDWKVCTQPEGG